MSRLDCYLQLQLFKLLSNCSLCLFPFLILAFSHWLFKLFSVVTLEQQLMGKCFKLMAQHSLVLWFIPAWKAIFCLDLLYDNALPMGHGLVPCQIVQASIHCSYYYYNVRTPLTASMFGESQIGEREQDGARIILAEDLASFFQGQFSRAWRSRLSHANQ